MNEELPSTTPEQEFKQTLSVATTLDNKPSLGIYSMSAPSSAISSSESVGTDSFSSQSTTAGTNQSPSSILKTGILDRTTAYGRKPILVTGIPSSNRRHMYGDGVSETLSSNDEDTMARIPITTPHSTTMNKIIFIQNKSGVGGVMGKSKNIVVKGNPYTTEDGKSYKIPVVENENVQYTSDAKQGIVIFTVF